MAELLHNPNKVRDGLAHFLEQYKESTDLRTLLQIYLEAIQEAEDVAFDVIIKRFLANATGIQLDIIGALVGELRQNKGDVSYKLWITARIRLNRSFGRPIDVIECLRLVTTAAFEYEEFDSACFVVSFIDVPDLSVVNDLNAIAYLAKAAGTTMVMVYPTDGEAFLFKEEGAPDDADHGFSDYP